jgi:hypothetical protein
MNRTLGHLDLDKRIDTIIHGCAPGADTWADRWATFAGRNCERYPADWRLHGRAAGPIRNAQMLAEGKPDLVVAFPGGKGTQNMVRQARAYGVRVIEIPGRGEALPKTKSEEST